MKRNGHRLNHIRTKQFGLDRNNCCKYGSFFDIYDSIEKALIGEKVLMLLEEPEFQNKYGTVLNLNHRLWL